MRYRDLVEDESDPLTRARLTAGLAEALDSSGQFGRVITGCEQALASLKETGLPADDPEALGLRISLLAREASALRATGDLRGAIDRVRRALPLAGEGKAAEPAQRIASGPARRNSSLRDKPSRSARYGDAHRATRATPRP